MTSPTGEIINSSQQRSSRRPAFSLIELILVLLLLSLTASMVSPMLSGFTRGRNNTDAAAHMLAIMQYAQEQAAITTTVYRLNFDLDNATYWLSSAPKGIDGRIKSEIGRTFTLPVNTTLDIQGNEELSINRYIQFEADASHDMAVIRIVDSKQKQIVIACPSPSEAYRIGSPDQLRDQGQW